MAELKVPPKSGEESVSSYSVEFKATLCCFDTFKLEFQNHFYNSLTFNGESGTTAIDKVPPAGRV